MITIKYIGIGFIIRDSIAESKEQQITTSPEAEYWKDNYFNAMKLLEDFMISDVGKVVWNGFKKDSITNQVLLSIAENG